MIRAPRELKRVATQDMRDIGRRAQCISKNAKENYSNGNARNPAEYTPKSIALLPGLNGERVSFEVDQPLQLLADLNDHVLQ
jgi:hypothetical protein